MLTVHPAFEVITSAKSLEPLASLGHFASFAFAWLAALALLAKKQEGDVRSDPSYFFGKVFILRNGSPRWSYRTRT